MLHFPTRLRRDGATEKNIIESQKDVNVIGKGNSTPAGSYESEQGDEFFL